MEAVLNTRSEFDIVELDSAAIDLVNGGAVYLSRAFTIVGMAQSILWLGDRAFDVGYWIGKN